DQLLEELLPLLPQLGAKLEVAVIQGVEQRLLQGDAVPDSASFVAEAEPAQMLLEETDQRRNQGTIVLQDEVVLPVSDAVLEPLMLTVFLGRHQNLLDGLSQVALQGGLGDIAGGPLLQSANGHRFTAVTGHDDDRHLGIISAEGLDQPK